MEKLVNAQTVDGKTFISRKNSLTLSGARVMMCIPFLKGELIMHRIFHKRTKFNGIVSPIDRSLNELRVQEVVLSREPPNRIARDQDNVNVGELTLLSGKISNLRLHFNIILTHLQCRRKTRWRLTLGPRLQRRIRGAFA